MADNGTEWKFITPAVPFHGGLWEAAVKSTKKHLLKVVSQRVLTYNQLATMLVKIEGILNSRPLIALHDDLESGLALTPAHFLVGRPILGLVRTVDIVYNSAHTNCHGLFTLHTCQRPVQKVCGLLTAEEDVLDSGPAGQDV